MSTNGRLRGEAGLAVSVSAVLTALTFITFEGDTYWHLASGRWMVGHWQIVRSDPFSWTMVGKEWINHSWLADLLFYGAHAVAGDRGVVGLGALTSFVTYGILMWRLPGSIVGRAVAVSVFALSAADSAWTLRPRIFSLLLLAVLITELRQPEAHLRRASLLVCALLLTWVHLHGGFVVGLLAVICFAFESGRWPRVSARILGAAGLALILAAMTSPYGTRALLQPFQVVVMSSLPEIMEWQAPSLGNGKLAPLVGIVCIVGASCVLLRGCGRGDALLVGSALVLAVMSIRNIPILALVSAPMVSLAVTSLAPDLGRNVTSGARRLMAWSPAAAVPLCLLVQAAWVQSGHHRPKRWDISEGLIKALRTADRRVFNSYKWGGYLIWAAPEVPVFIDGRTDLYGDEFMRTYLKLVRGAEAEVALNRMGIEVCLVDRTEAIGKVLAESPLWHEVLRDYNGAILFERIQRLRGL